MRDHQLTHILGILMLFISILWLFLEDSMTIAATTGLGGILLNLSYIMKHEKK
ncbi:MAG: hypothetical protein ACFFB3_14540 [Candidatus Hodarchaeota archaeon]